MGNARQRFQERHLGAEPGTLFNFYTAHYRESETAQTLTTLAWTAIWLFFLILMIVLYVFDKLTDSMWFLIGIAVSVLLHRGIIIAARYRNNADVRRKIRESVEYAQYFAAKYPAQAHLCEELNEAYTPGFDPASPPKSPGMPMWERMQDALPDKLVRITLFLVIALGFFEVIVFPIWIIIKDQLT